MPEKKLRVALIAPLEEPVPPEKYGGTELVVANIADTLVDMGHEVHLLASGDSKTKAILHAIVPRAIRREEYAIDPGMRDAFKFIAAGRVLEVLNSLKLDIIHNHLGWRFMPFIPSISTPVVTTLHGPLTGKKDRLLYSTFPNSNIVSISNSQREPLQTLNYSGTVYNGIDIKKFDFLPAQGEYLAFLGRMSPEKGPRMAIDAAKAFGMKLIMAAKVDVVDETYFKAEVEPHIDGKDIVFLGEIGPEEKNKLLSGAYALIGPINWPEPFGLFMIESMACGTPVVVTNMGSAPEVVVDGKTGFVVANEVGAFVDALKKIPSISREACRERVELFFTRETMTKNYVDVYRKLIK